MRQHHGWLEDLLSRGVRFERRGDRLHVEAPAGVLTDEDRALLAERRDAVLSALDSAESIDATAEVEALLLETRMRREAWASAVVELAEAAGHPAVPLAAGVSVSPGPLGWARFTSRASVPALRTALVALRELLAAYGVPGGDR